MNFTTDIVHKCLYVSQFKTESIGCLYFYSDDGNLKVSSKNLHEILELISFIELSNIIKFLNDHNLKLNDPQLLVNHINVRKLSQ